VCDCWYAHVIHVMTMEEWVNKSVSRPLRSRSWIGRDKDKDRLNIQQNILVSPHLPNVHLRLSVDDSIRKNTLSDNSRGQKRDASRSSLILTKEDVF
jgi:hypothetical protein